MISPLPVAWLCSLYLMWNKEQEEKRILVTKATEQDLGKMSDIILCCPPQGFQHKQWEAEEALQGIPRWRWHPHQSKLLACFLPFSFFSSSSEISSELRKWNTNLNRVTFLFLLHTLSCCSFLLSPSLRADNVFGFHQAKPGKESVNVEGDVQFFSLFHFWSEA